MSGVTDTEKTPDTTPDADGPLLDVRDVAVQNGTITEKNGNCRPTIALSS